MLKKEIRNFIIVGIINTIVGLGSTYLLFNVFGINYWYSTFIGNCIGIVVSFVLNRKFTFNQQGKVLDSMIRFIVVVTVCYFVSYWLGRQISNGIISMLARLKNYNGDIAILFGAGLYTISNVFGQKFIVFRKESYHIRNAGVPS